jgi:hypothetical protein
MWNFGHQINGVEAFLGMPVLVLVVLLILLARIILRGRRSADAVLETQRFTFALFSLLMLDRMILNTRIFQYGFVSAACAMMLIVMVLLAWLPQMLDQLGRSGTVLRGAMLGLLLGIVLIFGQSTALIISKQTIVLDGGYRGGGGNVEVLDAAMKELKVRARPGDSLAALPEACWVNFVTGMPNPTPYELLDPIGVLRAGGEEAIFRAYQASPPTWILLVHHDTSDIGPRFFGRDYFKAMRQWIDENYEQVELFGAPPLRNPAFGIAMFRRRQV